MVLKEAYFKKVLVIIKIKKPYNDKLEEYNLDLAQIQRSAGKLKKPIIN